MNDPRITELNETQLFLEVEAINLEEERKYEDLGLIAKAAKKAIINLLGLNLLPIEDSETKLLRMPEDHEILPLIMFIGHEGILKGLSEKVQDLEAQELALKQVEEEKKSGKEEISTDEFLDFMESDLEFVDEKEIKRLSVINSPGYEYLAKNVVNEISKKDKKEFEEIFGTDYIRNTADLKKVLSSTKSFISDEDAVEKRVDNISKSGIKIESDEVSESFFPNGRRKRKIIIESDEDDNANI
jgi:hypothetical protein